MMDEFEKRLENHVTDSKQYPQEKDGHDMLKMCLHEYRAFKAKQEAKDRAFVEGCAPCKCGAQSAYINTSKIVCCGDCGAPLDIIPSDQKPTAPASLVEGLRECLQKVNKKDYPESWVDGYERAISDLEDICKM